MDRAEARVLKADFKAVERLQSSIAYCALSADPETPDDWKVAVTLAPDASPEEFTRAIAEEFLDRSSDIQILPPVGEVSGPRPLPQ